MLPTETHGIGDQNTAYRRGMVLGLTMAEVGILIIFVLLLLIGFFDWLRRKDQASLASAEAMQKEVENSIPAAKGASPDEIRMILKALNEVAKTSKGSQALEETKAALSKMREAQKELETNGIPTQTAKQLSQQSFEIARLNEELQKTSSQLKDAQQLADSLPLLKELQSTLQLGANPSPDEIQRMVRSLLETSQGKKGESTLKEMKDAISEMRRVKNEIAGKSGSEGLAQQVEDQSYRIANQGGQLARYEDALKEAGLGKGERPCWVRPDGTIEYLYDVVLQDDGIRMREYTYENRVRERSFLPLPRVHPDEVLSIGEFLRRTEPLYQNSLAKNCRFFVVIYDGTGPTRKERYKQLLRAVEGHFYKRLDLGKPPF